MDSPRVPLPGLLQPHPGSTFVGRTEELSGLLEQWSQLPTGRRVTLLAGEPGAGKTRLLRELATRLWARGALVLYGGCEDAPGPAYQPVTEAMNHLLSHGDRAALAADVGPYGGELGRLFPHLVEVVPAAQLAAPVPPEAEQHRLHTAVVDLIANTSARTPILLLLDDMQWATRSTLLLLQRLLRTRPDAAMLVVCAFRDGAEITAGPLAETLAELARMEGVQHVKVPGLEVGDVAALLATDRSADIPGDVPGRAEQLHRLTGGNPYLLHEAWRQLRETGELATTPASVRRVVAARLARVAPATRRLLETAAVAGATVHLTLLQGATQLSQVQLIGALEEALGDGSLQEAPGVLPAYRFTHELLRRAVTDGLSPLARAQLHQQLGEALERLPGDESHRLVDLAAHFTGAVPIGPIEKAVRYNLRAAEFAVHQLAFDDAARMMTNAVDLGVPESERLHVLLELGGAQRAAGAWVDAVETYRSAALAARRDGDVAGFAAAALGLEETCWRPGITDAGATELLAEAMSLVGGSDHRLRVRLLAASARAHGYRGARDEAASARVEAVRLARELGDDHALGWALAQSYWGRGSDTPEEVVDALTEAMHLARASGDDELECFVHAWRIPLLVELGRLDAVRNDSGRFRTLGAGLGQPIYQYHTDQADAALALAEGRLDEAEVLAERALERSRLQGYEAGGAHGIQMFGVRREQGRLDEVARLVQALGSRADTVLWRPGLAALYAATGMEAEARREIARLCADDFAEVPDGPLRLAALAYVADACSTVADRAHAPAVLAELSPLAGRNLVVAGVVACYGSAHRYLGMLAACTGDLEGAADHLRAAVASDTQGRLWTWAAHSRIELARVLLRRAEALDLEEASGLLDEARRLAQRHGLARVAARIGEEERRARAAELPDGLTQRELEVLRLVAEGCSNRDIGRRLFITQNTAANHVRSILMKTGSANRTEAAAYAHGQGLVEVSTRQG